MIENLILYRALLQYAIVFGVTIWAMARGGEPEKASGIILSLCIIAFLLANATVIGEHGYRDVVAVYLVIDCLVFLALVPLAMRANRIYPLWLLAAQLIMLVMHFQRFLPDIDPLGYFVLTHGPSWVQAVAFLLGMILHRRRENRFGPYRSWRTQSRPS